MARTLVWFRSDLRTIDNTALHHACEPVSVSAGKTSHDRGVIAVFNISPGEWRAHDVANVRLDLMRRTLMDLAHALAALNIPLRFVHSRKPSEIPKNLLALAKSVQCDRLFFNKEYELNESRRDQDVIRTFESAGLQAQAFDDQTILAPGSVLTQQDRAFSVFTPFKKRWMQVLETHARCPSLGKPRKQPDLACKPDAMPPAEDFRIDHQPITKGLAKLKPADMAADQWPAGEKYAIKRLADFASSRIDRYKTDRDLPAIDGTSTLSPYLTIGTISPRQCLHAALEANNAKPDTGKVGPVQWISELVWRDFYHHLLFHFPKLSMSRAFRPATDKLHWSYDEAHFERWCTGMTGVPIVDAAMRQLNTTGWMHNRCRMIVAMYLTKDYFIDWRWGEKYFMQRLVDGNLASNNGGWQWSASTGTDAAPYFRIYNPITQGRTHDPKGVYIRRYCPELRGLSDKTIHEPSKLSVAARAKLNYPDVAVDHGQARDRVMKEFKRISGA